MAKSVVSGLGGWRRPPARRVVARGAASAIQTGRGHRSVRLLVLLAASLCLESCWSPEPPRFNLLLISLDTVRADALGAYGYPQLASPQLDRLAVRSLLFERAYATAPFTGPSHASILTSQHPSVHGLIYNGHRRPAQMTAASVTLAEHLRGLGFVTAAFVSAGPLAARYGFDRGFDDFRLIDSPRHGDVGGSGADTTNAAAEWLESHAEERFFLWVHYIDPHLPYVCDEGVFEEMGVPWARVGRPWRQQPSQDELERAYRAEVYETDREVGRLLSVLARLDLDPSTVMAVVADHGEYLHEHQFYGHFELYDEMLHVPMMVHWPGQESGERRREPVSTIDLVPTLLPLLGAPPLPAAQGRDLRSAQASRRPHPVFAEWRHFGMLESEAKPRPTDFLVSVQLNDLKLIQSVVEPGYRLLFDLAQDPGELDNLADRRADLYRRMEGLLKQHIQKDLPAGLIGVADIKLDAESRAMLEALGYL